MTEHTVFVIGGDDDETVSFTTEDVGNTCRLICLVRGEKAVADAPDFFEALQTIRRRSLEPKGLIPFCYGASLNVWPSGMARDMGRGLRAYKMYEGQPATELVGIFQDGPDIIPSPVAAQEEFAREWLASFRKQAATGGGR